MHPEKTGVVWRFATTIDCRGARRALLAGKIKYGMISQTRISLSTLETSMAKRILSGRFSFTEE